MVLLDILRDQTNPRAGFALVLIPHDVLAIERLTNLLDIILQAAVGEERLRRGGRGIGGRTRQRPSAHGDVCQELRDLERVALLLQKLVVQRRVLSLLRLLLDSAGTKLRLSPLESRLLGLSAQACHTLPVALPHAVQVLASPSEGGTVSLRGCKLLRLLLLGCCKGLPVALVHQAGHSLAGGQFLLPREVGLGDTPSIATKGPRLNLVAQDLRLLLALLLAQVGHGGVHHAAQVGRHVLVDVLARQGFGVHCPSRSQSKPRAGLIAGIHGLPGIVVIWRSHALGLVDV